jgi:hypothetical protein
MSNLDKIIEAINVPKRIVDGAEKFLSKLLGPAISESGQLISDQIRFRRFKNQVTIFTKAKDLLEEKGIQPKQVNLKILAPLVEYSSLEEDEKLQTIWANVVANISTYDTEQSFNLKCIEILKEITPHEILLLDYIFEKFKTKEKETLKKWKDKEYFKNRTTVSPDNAIFSPWTFKDDLTMTQEQVDLYVDRLVSFGVIKFEQPELSESSSDTVITDVMTGMKQTVEVKSYELETSDRIHFTSFGLYFVKLCKFNP